MRLINVPVKVPWVAGEFLLEAHPPVNAQGESFEPDVDKFSDLLRAAVGDTTVAINWDYAREVLQRANGVIATALDAGAIEARLRDKNEAGERSRDGRRKMSNKRR